MADEEKNVSKETASRLDTENARKSDEKQSVMSNQPYIFLPI